MHKQVFPEAIDLVQAFRDCANKSSNDDQANNQHVVDEDYYNRILSTYLLNDFSLTTFSTVYLSLGESIEAIRGNIYAQMNFDERFELMKKLCRKLKPTLQKLEDLHVKMLKGCQDECLFNHSTGVSERLRTVVIYCERDDKDRYDCYVQLRSSPKGSYLSSRFKQKFGIETTLNVQFSFPRMGIHSQLHFIEHEKDIDFLHPTSVNDIHRETMKRYYQFLDSTTSEKKDKGFNHKIRIQQELFSFHEIKKYLERDISVCGCQFSLLCQNMSGMHSYRYTYFSPHLSVMKGTTIDSVMNWAVPKIDNQELYQSEKKLKLALRLSLFNTPTIKTLQVKSTDFCTIEDIGDCTDGCGFISPEYASKIAQMIREYGSVRKFHTTEANQYDKELFELDTNSELVGYLPENYIPSAFQIRFMGAKGMLCVKTDLFETIGCHIALRHSMVKIIHPIVDFEPDSILHSLQIVGFSTPSNDARLNIPILHILNGTSDSSGVVQQKIMNHLQDMIENVTNKYLNTTIQEAVQMYVEENDFAALGVLAMEKDLEMAFLAGPFRTHLRPMKIPLSNSRRLYGIADPYGVLGPNEVFVNISNVGIVNGTILVTKEPCFHRGDLRKIDCVNCIQLSHLKDVIVFPTTAKRPIPNTIAGSDLDGDEYFICWDPSIVDHVEEFEPGEFDINKKDSFSNVKSFEPDAFKYWVGVRMAFADFFDREWTSDENWENTMKILSDILNSAIDAPKQGGIIEIKRDALIRFIKEFPGHPHYMNKDSANFTIESQSFIGNLYDTLLERVSQKVKCVVKSEKLDTSSKCLKTMTISMLDYYSRSFAPQGGENYEELDNLFFNLGLGGFIKHSVREIKEGKRTILYVSEFLNKYWRNLGFGKLELEQPWFYCRLKGKLTNLTPKAVDFIADLLTTQERSPLLVCNGIHPGAMEMDHIILSDPITAEYNVIFQDETAEIFIFYDMITVEKTYALLNDTMYRLGINNFISDEKSETADFFSNLKQRKESFIYIDPEDHDEKLKTRFDILGLCGLGTYRELKEKSIIENYTNLTNDYLSTLDLSQVTHLQLQKETEDYKISRWNQAMDGYQKGEPVDVSLIFGEENDSAVTILQFPYQGPGRCKAITSSYWISHLLHLNLSFNQIGNEGVKYLVEGNFNALSELDLSCNQIGVEGIQHLAQQSNNHFPNLKSLNLNFNAVTSQGIMYLCSDGDCFSKLESLFIRYCKILDLEQGSLDTHPLSHITRLSLTPKRSNDSLEFLCSHPIASRLTELDIAGNDIDIEGAHIIGKYNFENLKTLVLKIEK